MRILLMTLALVYVAMAADDEAGSLLKRLVNLLEEPGQTWITDLSKRDNVPADKKQMLADPECNKLCRDDNVMECRKFKAFDACDERDAAGCMASCHSEMCPDSCKKQYAGLGCDNLCKDLKPGMCSSVKAKGRCQSRQGALCVATCFPTMCPDSCKSKRDNVPADKKQMADPSCKKLCLDDNVMECRKFKAFDACDERDAAGCMASCHPDVCPDSCKKQTADPGCNRKCKDVFTPGRPGLCKSVKAQGNCQSRQGKAFCNATCFPNKCPDSCKS